MREIDYRGMYIKTMKVLIDLRFFAKTSKRDYIQIRIEEITGNTFKEVLNELG